MKKKNITRWDWSSATRIPRPHSRIHADFIKKICIHCQNLLRCEFCLFLLWTVEQNRYEHTICENSLTESILAIFRLIYVHLQLIPIVRLNLKKPFKSLPYIRHDIVHHIGGVSSHALLRTFSNDSLSGQTKLCAFSSSTICWDSYDINIDVPLFSLVTKQLWNIEWFFLCRLIRTVVC